MSHEGDSATDLAFILFRNVLHLQRKLPECKKRRGRSQAGNTTECNGTEEYDGGRGEQRGQELPGGHTCCLTLAGAAHTQRSPLDLFF